MLMRFFPCLATFCLIALPTAARPAEEKATPPPTLVVRVQSIDNLRENLKYFGKLAGREREVEMLESGLNDKLRPTRPPSLPTTPPPRPTPPITHPTPH